MKKKSVSEHPPQELLIGIKKEASEWNAYKTWVPPGHYCSPIPSNKEVLKRAHTIYNDKPMAGIKINSREQLKLLKELRDCFTEQAFSRHKLDTKRYYFDNDWFGLLDASVLCALLSVLAPKKVIEVGSGFSSAAMLDAQEQMAGPKIDFTFIEPDLSRLSSLLKEEDAPSVHIKQASVQDVDVELFKTLNEGDILFIDSSHVTKSAGDVNYIFFEIIPNLKKGVYIHFHDIFYNFEYPLKWVLQGRSWNESYLLRSFLLYNNSFKIILFNNYLYKYYSTYLHKISPSLTYNYGSSLWLKKIR